MAESENDECNGSPKVPATITVSKFTAARGKEIQIMRKSLIATSGTKLAFQKLPKHMRRRAMSHNVKRLPKRLRNIHKNQMKKSGLAVIERRPSRRHKRRPFNLLQEYTRRQRRIKWLHTHIWHAKRFHMIEKWGFKLAYRSCDRAFRACYRATKEHCLLQDISYFNCVEINGKYEHIVGKFKVITDGNLGLTIGAKSFKDGSREGNITLFKYKCEPKKAIGLVYFHWKPIIDTEQSSLWLWVHPAFYAEALETLVDCFEVKQRSMQSETIHETIYTNNENAEIRELCSELSRLRLTGPLATAVLQKSFQLTILDPESMNSDWITEYTKNPFIDIFRKQHDFWESLKSISSSAVLPPNMILSLVIKDPRTSSQKKRVKALPQQDPLTTSYVEMPQSVPFSPKWNCNVRQLLKSSKMPDITLNEVRKNLLVPGSEIVEATPIPVILIQRPGDRQTGYSSGWDVIVSSVWTQPVWISLIMWGARAGGLRETDSMHLEMGKSDFLYPDTKAGLEEELYHSVKYKETFFRKPPNKRMNYNKLNIVSPFEWNWRLLLSDWRTNNEPVEDVFVLRDKKLLRKIQENIISQISEHSLPIISQNSLLPVKLKLEKKGLCKRFSIICLPQSEDYKKIPVEPKSKDKFQQLRSKCRKTHKALLKKLHRRRQRARQLRRPVVIEEADEQKLKHYTEQMRQYWLPPPKDIRKSCSREVIGFVKCGDFTFTSGSSNATGYIAATAVPELLNSQLKNRVIVRNTDSKQYRFAILEIICE